MENASKALIMAAGVLIGIILLSLMVYMFTNFAITSAEVHKENEQNQLNQFNSQFTSYVGKEGLTIYDVVTVANLATESNIYYEYPQESGNIPKDNSYISVILNNSQLSSNNKHIEKGYKDTRNNTYKQEITSYYNKLIQEALNKDMVPKKDNPEDLEEPTYMALREYTCKVDISEKTGRVYLVTFTAK